MVIKIAYLADQDGATLDEVKHVIIDFCINNTSVEDSFHSLLKERI